MRRELLPFDRQHPVALQVAERAVVAEDVEAVRVRSNARPGLCRRLVRSPTYARTSATRSSAEQRAPARAAALRAAGVRVTDRGEHLVLAVGIPVDEADLVGRLGPLVAEQALDERVGVVARRGQVRRPRSAALGTVDAHEERRDDLAELVEHQLGVHLRLGQRMGAHAQEQRLEGLARCRRCRRSRAWPRAAGRAACRTALALIVCL